LIGLFGATVGALFLAFPNELVVAIAGFALLGTIGSALATALGQETEREPALLTFLVTASGIALAGIGSAFWGLLAGLAALLVLQAGLRHCAGRVRRAAGAAGQRRARTTSTRTAPAEPAPASRSAQPTGDEEIRRQPD
jgi:hypothetical protein